MNSQFILNYTGTKYKETKELDGIDFSKYDTIVEPFGGSFGFSRYLWQMKGMTDKRYIIYDLDTKLINFYKHIQTRIKDGTIDAFLKEYNDLIQLLADNCDLKKKYYSVIDRKLVKPYLQGQDEWILYMVEKNCLQSMIPKPLKKNKCVFLDMIEKTTFINKSFFDIDMSEYKSPTTLIYVDPPYLGEFNGDYKGHTKDVEQNIYRSILDLMNNEYKVLLVHISGGLIDIVFNEFRYFEYAKLYQLGNKKRVKHVVYYNDGWDNGGALIKK